MKKEAPKLEFPEPPHDWSFRLADALRGQREVDKEVLWRLVGHPQTYGELRGLLGRHNDNNLTQALRRLRRDGLIRSRSDTSTQPAADHYEPTELGVAVFVALVRRETILQLADQVQRSLPDGLPA